MSRTKALETFEWEKVNRRAERARVKLLSAGLDEVPGVYKDIHQVMAAQSDLVRCSAGSIPGSSRWLRTASGLKIELFLGESEILPSRVAAEVTRL
jgi:hypothetical protein